MNKILILDSTGCDWTDNQMRNAKVDVQSIYWSCFFVLRVCRRIYFALNLPLKYIWYGQWRNELDKYDSIIIFSALLETDIFRYLNKKYAGKIIFYYRDIKELKKYPPEKIKKICDKVNIWSFDKSSAIQHKIKYNPQFYFYNVGKEEAECIYDVAFIGAARERIDEILFIKDYLDYHDISNRFHVFSNKNFLKNSPCISNKKLDYSEIININSRCKAILEINQPGQTGLTVRALEALFMKKKLITNNTSIINEKFYKKQNVFIIGINRIDDLKKFLDLPYCDVDNKIVEYYSYNSWLERFQNV